MTDLPLISITKSMSSHSGTVDPGSVNYAIHSDDLARYLAADVGHIGGRREQIVAELRSLADALENGAHPFVVVLAEAEKLAARGRKP